MFTRVITNQTLATDVGRARTGVRTSVVSRIDRRVIDERVVSTATIPFIRSRFVSFVGRSLKPNTRLYAFFDEIDVNTLITPASNVQVTMSSGTFDYDSSAEFYAEENELPARKISDFPQGAFNKGDIVYVVQRGATTYTLSTTPATGVLGYVGNGNILYLNNIKGSFVSNDVVNGTISGASATLNASVTSSSMGSPLITNASGDAVGTFFIPNTPALKFRTGSREFVLSDSPTNSRLLANTTARVSYIASGTLQTRQSTIAATRNAEIVRETVSGTDTITISSENITDSGWYDPLAQTFLVDLKNGCFLTKVDIFFQSKDANLPVTLEIRTTVNGYPGKRVLPFGRVVKRSEDILTSNDATVATTFTFDSPIYVEENAEYCIVLLSDSTEYKVWISQLGEDAVGTDRRISQQPYAGVLFKSQNASTWTADQLQDLKFKLYRAQFDISAPAYFTYVNESIPPERLPRSGVRLFTGTNTVRITHPNHGMRSGSNVIITGLGSEGNIYNIPSSNINGQHTISNVTIDSYTINTINVASETVSLITSNLFATYDLEYNVLHPIVQFRNFNGTSVNFTANTTAATFFAGRSSSPVAITANDNNYFDEPQAIKATVNETISSGSNRKSFELNATLQSTLDNLSPVIDLNRSSLVTVVNRINNSRGISVDKTYRDTTTLLVSNTKIRFANTEISTNDPVVANIFGQIIPGKVLIISNAGNVLNNTTAVVKMVSNFAGVANVNTSYYFAPEGTGNAITLKQIESHIDERAPQGGTNAAKYVTRQINLTNPSKFLKIMFAANIPIQGEIDVYYRTLPIGSLIPLNEKNYEYATPLQPHTRTDNPTLYTDVNYEIDDIPSFTAVAVKIVFRSTNSSKVPSIKDLRIIACP